MFLFPYSPQVEQCVGTLSQIIADTNKTNANAKQDLETVNPAPSTQWQDDWPAEADVLNAYLEWIIKTHGKMEVHGSGVTTVVNLEDVFVSLRAESTSAFERRHAKVMMEDEVRIVKGKEK